MHLQKVVAASTVFTYQVSATHLSAPELAQLHSFSLRQFNFSEQAYLSSVCTPPSIPNAPCQVIDDIASACQPNGTSTLAYLAHQECICNGGFFSNWLGCLNCIYVHGGDSKAQSIVSSQILISASNALCTGTPTANFVDIYSSLANTSPNAPTTAGTGTTDLFPSRTEVSIYYTANGGQGPGAITGSAAQATSPVRTSQTWLAGASSVPGSASIGGAAGLATSGTAAGSSANSGSASAAMSSSGAIATNIVSGLLGMAAVGAVMVAI